MQLKLFSYLLVTGFHWNSLPTEIKAEYNYYYFGKIYTITATISLPSAAMAVDRSILKPQARLG